MSAGWYSYSYTSNHPVLFKPRGRKAYFITPGQSVKYRSNYAIHRPQEIVPDQDDKSETAANDRTLMPAEVISRQTRYQIHRAETPAQDAPTQVSGRRLSRSKKRYITRPVHDLGLGSTPAQIAEQCEAYKGQHKYAVQIIFSPDPALVKVADQLGADVIALTERANEAFIPALFDHFGVEGEVDYSYVTHLNLDKEARLHPHVHNTIAATSRDPITGARTEVPYVKSAMLSQGHDIARQIVEHEMDQTLGRHWRLALPEYAHTFYDQKMLPQPGFNSDLDGWFPPASAYIPEPTDGFGDTDDLQRLVDDLFPADFWAATQPINHPSLKATDEPEQGHEAVSDDDPFIDLAALFTRQSDHNDSPEPAKPPHVMSIEAQGGYDEDLTDPESAIVPPEPVFVNQPEAAVHRDSTHMAGVSYPEWLMPFHAEVEEWHVLADDTAAFAIVGTADETHDGWTIALVARWMNAQDGHIERTEQIIDIVLPTDYMGTAWSMAADTESLAARAKADFEDRLVLYQQLMASDPEAGLGAAFEGWLRTSFLDAEMKTPGFLPDLPDEYLPFDKQTRREEWDGVLPFVHWVPQTDDEDDNLAYGIALRWRGESHVLHVIKRWQAENGEIQVSSAALWLTYIDNPVEFLDDIYQAADRDPHEALKAISQFWAEAYQHDPAEFLSDGPRNPFDVPEWSGTSDVPFQVPDAAPDLLDTDLERLNPPDIPPALPHSTFDLDW